MTPTTPPIYVIEPSHDCSSIVMPPGNGELSDCKIVKAGESHPSPHPTDNVAKLAIFNTLRMEGMQIN